MRPSATELAASRALAALREVGFAWAVAALVASRDQLSAPVIALALMGVAGLVTAAPLVGLGRPDPTRQGAWLTAELVTGFALAAATGLVYDHDGSGPSSIATLGGMWPLVGVLGAGLRWGGLAGAAAGAGFGIGRLVGAVSAAHGWPEAASMFSVVSTGLLSIVAGYLAAALLRWAGALERRAAEASVREAMAREVHDGVLQTLAAIEARSTDGLAQRLARAESRRVREHLFGDTARSGSFEALLTDALGAVEDRFGVRCELAFVDHVALEGRAAAELAAAVGEAATNAAKHGGVGCTVLVVPEDDGLTITVHDEGPGFDAASARHGSGLRSSVFARLSELGGSAEVSSSPGRGCEVRLWLPYG